MADVLHLFARALTLFGVWLDTISPIPWPLGIAAFLPLYAIVLSFAVWWMRGTVLPLQCAYRTTKKLPCKRIIPGEWHRCWYHRRVRFRRTDRHQVDPYIRRWQKHDKNGNCVEREDAWGAGFIRLRSRTVTLLYYKGYAKPIPDVLRFVPDLRNDIQSRWRTFRQDLTDLRQEGAPLRTLFRSRIAPAQSLLSERIPTVIRSTRVTLALVFLGLLLVILGIFLGVGPEQPLNYAAALAFVAAWAFTLEGIWRTEEYWIRLSLVNTMKWFGPFLAIAIIGGLLDISGRVLGID